MKLDKPRPVLLQDYAPPSHLIDTVDLNVVLDPAHTRVRARLAVRPNPARADHAAPLQLNGSHLELADLMLNGKAMPPAAYSVDADSLTIHRPPRTPFTLDITTFVNPSANTALQGLYRSRGVYCTQCEAEGFRRITYFLDRPDVLSVYDCRIEAEVGEAPVLLANGNPGQSGRFDRGRRHFACWHDPHPKPCYLFALVGGDLSSVASEFTTQSGRRVDLRIYVEHGKEERAHWAMSSLKRAMRWDETRFGREYDLDVFNIVAVSDFNMGAMENKGLNIFNDRLVLASPDTATDTTFEAIESVVAHEYFHNWTGNRITCRDWFQLCLKEGLTVYRDQEFSADERDATVQRIQDVRQLRALQFPEDAGPLAHPVRPESYVEINNFYTPTVYEKGAEVVRMIETLLGRDIFRKGMDLYFERHDGDAATIEDFLACFADASGRDLEQLKLWYSQSGTPELVCSFSYDRAGRTARLEIEQALSPTPGQARKRPMHIPLKMGLIGHNGQEIDLVLDTGERIRDGLIEIRRRKETYRFGGIGSRPVPSLLRGFSAPVRLAIELSDRDMEFLVTHDRDRFNRWQAVNTYATRLMLRQAEALRTGKRGARGSSFARALGAALSDLQLTPAYRAELLKLPTPADLARETARNVDHGLIHRAHRQLLRVVATELGPQLEEIYAESRASGRFSPDAPSAGLRALRNAALSLLTARGGASDIVRLWTHFARAKSMTDEAHALHLLSGLDTPAREKALARFYERWKDDHLVVDIWLAAQAAAPREDAVEAVDALTRHPVYNRATPNKVRALVGTFANANALAFNRPDGAGYQLVTREVLAIDPINPQVAARMLGAFKSWRMLEPRRRGHALRALEKLSGASGLSRDVTEIITKMLDH